MTESDLAGGPAPTPSGDAQDISAPVDFSSRAKVHVSINDYRALFNLVHA